MRGTCTAIDAYVRQQRLMDYAATMAMFVDGGAQCAGGRSIR